MEGEGYLWTRGEISSLLGANEAALPQYLWIDAGAEAERP